MKSKGVYTTMLTIQKQSDITSAIRTIDSEIGTLEELKNSLSAENLSSALDLMQNAKGRIIVTGMGKSERKYQHHLPLPELLHFLYILPKQATAI